MAGNKYLDTAPAMMTSAITRAEKREDTRSKIALWYVLGFLIIIAYALVIFLLKDMTIDDLRDLLLAISGVLSGPLGFIIGYYFKSHQTDN